MRQALAIATFALAAQSVSASGQSPDFVFNKVAVNQVNSAIFETSPRGTSRTDNFWCAASEYAVRRLGADWKQNLYVVRGYARSQTTGSPTSVQFTLDPGAANVRSKSSGFGSGFNPGANVTVQKANTRCNRIPFNER
ncbi:hypothetical protein Q5Y75_05310 [Ruegeria sp. 2205SS24-7]|uniref:hypothetical protein n=1 Tax=Ruegeria discodermiae TaxID=3064389 RepID=UPI00274032EB|nr:hypothetical protein [Ruegeria sp. 2205SS24-7]MDP5216628.1 hypothetical protein [Ruegeria sp. 2205SS24-7]